MQHEIIETGDGSKTLFIPAMDEQYHSVNGALTESEYVFLEKGFRHHESNEPRIFEVGFGTGLNAFLTAMWAAKLKRETTFVSIEKYPLDKQLIEKLNYGKLFSVESAYLYEKIHAAAWGKEIQISEYFKLQKINDDIKHFRFNDLQQFDIIYFDAFGPDKQPNMWGPAIFEKIYQASAQNAVFVTYSAKGSIRRILQNCGYSMERLPGPPGKRQMLRGRKL